MYSKCKKQRIGMSWYAPNCRSLDSREFLFLLTSLSPRIFDFKFVEIRSLIVELECGTACQTSSDLIVDFTSVFDTRKRSDIAVS